jgi:hypothetical protein
MRMWQLPFEKAGARFFGKLVAHRHTQKLDAGLSFLFLRGGSPFFVLEPGGRCRRERRIILPHASQATPLRSVGHP